MEVRDLLTKKIMKRSDIESYCDSMEKLFKEDATPSPEKSQELTPNKNHKPRNPNAKVEPKQNKPTKTQIPKTIPKTWKFRRSVLKLNRPGWSWKQLKPFEVVVWKSSTFCSGKEEV